MVLIKNIFGHGIKLHTVRYILIQYSLYKTSFPQKLIEILFISVLLPNVAYNE